jgi:hypothetical protein
MRAVGAGAAFGTSAVGATRLQDAAVGEHLCAQVRELGRAFPRMGTMFFANPVVAMAPG